MKINKYSSLTNLALWCIINNKDFEEELDDYLQKKYIGESEDMLLAKKLNALKGKSLYVGRAKKLYNKIKK